MNDGCKSGLWLHINDSTPKHKNVPVFLGDCYDYILMIAHQNIVNNNVFVIYVMITY